MLCVVIDRVRRVKHAPGCPTKDGESHWARLHVQPVRVGIKNTSGLRCPPAGLLVDVLFHRRSSPVVWVWTRPREGEHKTKKCRDWFVRKHERAPAQA